MTQWDKCSLKAMKVVNPKQYELGRKTGISEKARGTGAPLTNGLDYLDDWVNGTAEMRDTFPSVSWWAGWALERWLR